MRTKIYVQIKKKLSEQVYENSSVASSIQQQQQLAQAKGLVFKSKIQLKQEMIYHFYRYRLIRCLEQANNSIKARKKFINTLSSTDIISFPPDIIMCYLRPLLETIKKERGERNVSTMDERMNLQFKQNQTISKEKGRDSIYEDIDYQRIFGGYINNSFIRHNVEGSGVSLTGPVSSTLPTAYSIQYMYNKLLVRAFYKAVLSPNPSVETLSRGGGSGSNDVNNPLAEMSYLESMSNPYYAILTEEARTLLHKCLTVAHLSRISTYSRSRLNVNRQAIDYVPLSFFRYGIGLGNPKGCQYIELKGSLGGGSSFGDFGSATDSMETTLDSQTSNYSNIIDRREKESIHETKSDKDTQMWEIYHCVTDMCTAVANDANRRRKELLMRNTLRRGTQTPQTTFGQRGQQQTFPVYQSSYTGSQNGFEKVQERSQRESLYYSTVKGETPFTSAIITLISRYGELNPLISTVSASLEYLAGPTSPIMPDSSLDLDTSLRFRRRNKPRAVQSADNIVIYFENIKKKKIQLLQEKQLALENEQRRLSSLLRLQSRIMSEEETDEFSRTTTDSSIRVQYSRQGNNYLRQGFGNRSYSRTYTQRLPPPANGREALIFREKIIGKNIFWNEVERPGSMHVPGRRARSTVNRGGITDTSASTSFASRRGTQNSLSLVTPDYSFSTGKRDGTLGEKGRRGSKVSIAPNSVPSLGQNCCIAISCRNITKRILLNISGVSREFSNVRNLCNSVQTTPAGCVITITGLQSVVSFYLLHSILFVISKKIKDGSYEVETGMLVDETITIIKKVLNSLTSANILQYNNSWSNDKNGPDRFKLDPEILRELLGICRVLGFVSFGLSLIEIGYLDISTPEIYRLMTSTDVFGIRGCCLQDFVRGLSLLKMSGRDQQPVLWARCLSEYNQFITTPISKTSQNKRLLNGAYSRNILAFSSTHDYKRTLVDLYMARGVGGVLSSSSPSSVSGDESPHSAWKYEPPSRTDKQTGVLILNGGDREALRAVAESLV